MTAGQAMLVRAAMGVRVVRRENPKARSSRRGFGVTAYVGANGSGKSASMVFDALPDLEAGRPVLSTVRILDYDDPRECDDETCMEAPDRLGHFLEVPTVDGRAAEVRNARRLFFEGEHAELEPVERERLGVHAAAHPGWIPWSRWDQLLRFNFGRVLADEMTGIASSRDSVTLPSEIVNHLQQLRRNEIPFGYTCPDWARADKSLREPTQSVTVCRGYYPVEAPKMGDRERTWKARRLFKWQTYDARELDKLTDGKRQELRPEVVAWNWGPGSSAFAAYDTFSPVLQVGTTVESGKCFRCGGRRKTVYCSCADHAPTLDRGVGAGVPPGEGAGAPPGGRRVLADLSSG